MKDTVTIITTYYNAEKYILYALISVMSQQFDKNIFNLEYLIIDDHSEDGTHELIDNVLNVRYADSPITVRHIVTPENLGCGGARKFGIDNASGNYLMFLDADDYYMNTSFVKRAYDVISNEKADIVEYGILVNYPNGSRQNLKVLSKEVIENKVQAECALFKSNKIKFNIWSKIIKKSLAQSFPYSDSRTYEDVLTIPVWLWNAKKIVIMPTIEINYRYNTNSIIRKDSLNTRIETIKAISSHFERFKNYKMILKAMYERSMIDLSAVLEDHDSNDEGFMEMCNLNRYMLSYIYPDKYKEIAYNGED